MSAYIEIKDLIKVYRTGSTEVIALRGLDLSVNEGEIVAVMGPSGCGKTTMLNILGGLDRPTAGQVIVDKMQIEKLSENELYDYRLNKIGFVFQFFNLMNSISAEENVELPMQLAGIRNSERKKRVAELLEMVGMSHRAKHKPVQMSGGEQQRVAIAVALANNPKVILADEPTGELDKKTGNEILELFRKLKEKYGKTLIIVTHDHRVSNIVDRTVFIEDGRIIGSLGSQEAKDMFSRIEEKNLDELSKSVSEKSKNDKIEKEKKLSESIERALKGGIE
ncbi:MAG: ABC transporter ATP-binding protein [Thermoplasmata archaeon]